MIFPSFYRNCKTPYNYSYNYLKNSNIDTKVKKSEEKEEKCNIDTKTNNFQEQIDNSKIFNFFGLSLHFDDLLIIAILFFLYSENVKDDFLFIVLILVLIS